MADSKTLLTAMMAGVLVAVLSSCGGSVEQDVQLDARSAQVQVPGAETELTDINLTQEELEAVGLETVPASIRRLTSELQAMGRILANQHRTAIVSYPFSARVAQIHARIGDWVEVGQKLVVLQSEEVGEASAAYYKAIADCELARLNHERESQLFRRGVGAQKNQFATEAGLRVAEANLNAAEKKLHVLGFSEEEITLISGSHQINPVVAVYSPITGKVVENNVVLGEMVDESTEILTIMDPTLLWVDAQIYEKDIARIRTGQEVAVTVPAYLDDVFSGTITYISDVLNEDTRTITVRTEVPNAGNRLKPGMFANVVIKLNTNGEAVALPVEAVLDDQEKQLLFVRTGPRQFEPRYVITGTREGGFVEIVSGVEVGEEVVTNGNFQLKSKLYEALLEAGHVH
ncbi:efflux RND transporter periplasmic adaptor subunit [Gemmatimonadota bacterium]